MPTSTRLSHGLASTLAPSWQPLKCEILARPVFILGLVLLLCSAALGQIVVPAETPRDKIVDATVTLPGVPADAKLLGTLTIDGADWREGNSKGLYHIVAPPGEYKIVASGWWITTRTVKLPDEPEPVEVITGMGQYNQVAAFKVTGGAGPDPPDPPPPGGKYRIVLFYSENQLDNLPQGQRDILTSLVFREWVRSQGHVLLEVLDPANFTAGSVSAKWKPWVDAVAGKALPIIALAPKDGPDNVVPYVVPDGIEAGKKFLQHPAVRKAVMR